jgi:hypothetical protein
LSSLPAKARSILSDYIEYFCLFSIPEPFQSIFEKLVSGCSYINKLFSLLIHKDKEKVVLSSKDNNFSFNYSGDIILRDYLLEIFESSFKKDFITQDINDNQSEQDIIKINSLKRQMYRKKGYIIVPDWVRAYIDLDFDDSNALFNRSAKRSIKKITDSKITFEIEKARHSIHFFYHQMYKPYIESIYGSKNLAKSYHRLKLFAKKSLVINIFEDGKKLAAAYLVPTLQKTLIVYAAGVLPGFDEAINGMLIDAIYYYSIVYAKDKKYKIIDFGLNRSFLDDGILNYKKKWGCKFRIEKSFVYDIAIKLSSESMKTFITRNPLFIVKDGDLAALFCFEDRIKNIEQLKRINEIWVNSSDGEIYILTPSGCEFDLQTQTDCSKLSIISSESDLIC